MSLPDYLLEDSLAKLEPPYKSRGEAQIGRLLDRYGISFFYEQPVIVQHRGQYAIGHPDFTLPAHDNLIVEYAGMPDREQYMAGIAYKEKVYKSNGIPAAFVFPSELTAPDWSERFYEKLREFCPQPLTYGHSLR